MQITPDAFKAYRLMNNMTQEQLSEAIGVSRRNIQNYESGVLVPTLTVALAIAAHEAGVKPWSMTPQKAREILKQQESSRKPITQRIKELIANKALLREQITKKLGVPAETVSEIVSRKITAGEWECDHNGFISISKG